MVSQTVGIVINTRDYHEFDQIITIFSLGYGKVSFYAPGVKKNNSKNKYSLQLFCESEFELFLTYHDDKLSKLKTGNLLTSHLFLANNYNDYLLGVLVCEITDQGFEPRDSDPQYYYLLKQTLNYLTSAEDNLIVVVMLMFYSLRFFGVQWKLLFCTRCFSKKNIKTISFSEEGLICKNCWQHGEVVFRVDLIKDIMQWQTLEQINFSTLVKYKTNNEIILLFRMLCEYYQDKIGLFSYSIFEMKKKSIYFK
ncbi:DNA repair protein RecO [Spiroplasma eriocheiris]|uniref:DNA repair protein RecO n=1 Tax=Spiroplasma eriocheiris TaxID=315358 RepID=A0A0H3XHY1_9MOLU|nr:DNA repair protein RecO [Spiroplasma eriocheiris]AHF57981.1 DNA repair/recombination protein [Spiroplasma eriocheiris CCTCC M 207170]AKM54423.1 DNA repair protein recO [Spiroplasma eriocheiris]